MNPQPIDSDQWVDRYANTMFRFTLFRVRDEEHAEEIVQNTFLAALQAKKSFSGKSTEKTWLFGILKHKIMDHFREVKRTRTYDLLPQDNADPCEKDFDNKGHWQALPKSWGINPEKATENKQLLKALSTCLDTLSDKFRQLFILKEKEKLGTSSWIWRGRVARTPHGSFPK
ncbi:MAG: sigma-70 family RNA polymerase sigma factor [Nitrospinaceae bacterium]